jgi:hypothetical protein
MPARIDQQRLAQELVEQARAEGMQLVGEGAKFWLTVLTEIETAVPPTCACSSSTGSKVCPTR